MCPFNATSEVTLRLLRMRLKSSWSERPGDLGSFSWWLTSSLKTARALVVSAWSTKCADLLSDECVASCRPESSSWTLSALSWALAAFVLASTQPHLHWRAWKPPGVRRSAVEVRGG